MGERALRAVEEACCRDCAVMCRNARTLADQMRLRDWTVEVEHDYLPDPDVILECQLHPERKVMRLFRAPAFYALDEAGRRHHLTHELVHALLRDLWETVRGGAHEELGGGAYRVFTRQVRLEMERVVDILAAVIAPSLPVLEW